MLRRIRLHCALLLALSVAAVMVAVPATPARAATTDSGRTMDGTFGASALCPPELPGPQLMWELHLKDGVHVLYAGGQVAPQGSWTAQLDLQGSYVGIHSLAVGHDGGGTYRIDTPEGPFAWNLSVTSFTWYGNSVAIEGTASGNGEAGTFTAYAVLSTQHWQWCQNSLRTWNAEGGIQINSA